MNLTLIFPKEFLDAAKAITQFLKEVPKPLNIVVITIKEEIGVKVAQKTIDLEIKKITSPLSASKDVKKRRVTITVESGAFYRLNGNIGEAPVMSDGNPVTIETGNIEELATISGEQDKNYTAEVVNVDDGGKESDPASGSFVFTDETKPESSGNVTVNAVDEEAGVSVDDGT